jgi:23S rRNA pseudouridine2605 synthase
MPAARKNKSSRDIAPKKRRSRIGEEPSFRKPSGKPFGKPRESGFEKREKPESGERAGRAEKPFGREKTGAADKPFKKREFGDKPFAKKSFGDKPFGKSKPSYRDKPSFGDRESRNDKPFEREKPPGKKDWGEKRAFGSKSSSSEKPAYGDKPFERKKFGESRPSDKPYGKRENTEKRSFGRDTTDKPYPSKEFKPREDKPFAKKSYGDKPTSFRDKPRTEGKPPRRENAFTSDKPFRSKERDARGPSSDRGEYTARPYNKAGRTDGPKDKASSYSKKKSVSTPTEANPDGLMRLNKYIANAGICSRREADKLIETGVISVNGKIVTELGFKVSPTDEINFGGQVLRKEKAVYILLNKPKDYITTLDDPEGRKTVLELIKNATRERVYPVGRLDRNTTGLLLLTNDGDLTKKLTHPRYGVKKIYQVSLDKALTKTDMQKIADGMELEDGPIKADDISYVGDGKDKNEIGIQLHSGRNRIVRRVFEHLGYDVVKLDRVYFAGLTKKDLPRGRWRLLTALEVSMLKMVPGE